MRWLLLTLASVLSVALAIDPQFKKSVDANFIERQKKILDVLSGISADNLGSKYHHEHQEITFNKPELFTKPKSLEDFMRGYESGFIPRDGVFTLNDYKSRHDTFSLFEIMYFAKDFDTFMEIAKWAKHELNAMQFSYAFTVAILHRSDCVGIYLPPFYEIFPRYFVPSEIMRQADIAALEDVEYRVFEVNNTGFEHSFYKDMISGASKSHPRWVGDDMESRVSYFREDPGMSHWYGLNMAWMATWLSPTRHPGIDFVMRGKGMYNLHKWILSRYNLERMSADMPFVVPFDWDKPVVGYNPRLSDHMGRPFTSRPDHMVPYKFNPTAFNYLKTVEERMHAAIDYRTHYDFKNNITVPWTDATGSDYLGKMIFGERDGIGRYYYKPWFFLVLEAVNDMVHSSNEREYSYTAFGKYLTMARDPVFYEVVAALDDWFQTYFESLEPYSYEKLSFPGVKVTDVEFDKLMTYFERWEFDITQGVAVKKPEDRENKKYLASHIRLNHKPFKFNITIESDRAQDALIRVFFGPKNNIDTQEMTLNQARHAYFTVAKVVEKLKPGVNVITRSSEDFYYYEHFEPLRSFKDRMDKAQESGKEFYIDTMSNCGLPGNLLLPKGGTGGRQYSVFVMAEPVEKIKFKGGEGKFYRCILPKHIEQGQLTYPFDRPINFPNYFKQPNMLFKNVKIYHKLESDLNTPSSS